MNIKILICSSPDLNYIDGSSIWAQTIALVFAEQPNVKIDFIAKSSPERFELYQPLIDKKNINIIDGTKPEYWLEKKTKRLSPTQLAELTVMLHDKNNYDVIIVRGLEIAQKLLDDPKVLQKCWLYLTDIPQHYDEYTEGLKKIIESLAYGAQFILCQTQGFIDLWKKLSPNTTSEKFKIYSPVIPDIVENLSETLGRDRKVVYAGKFKEDWKTLEMASLWPKISALVEKSELIMIGDKIHHEKNNAGYHDAMLYALENTKSLSWVGAKSRSETQSILEKSQIGLSWRSESMNETLEYSTKILEYGGAGCAVILNRNGLHEKLLGTDYPLYANSEIEFIEKVVLAFNDDLVLLNASKRMKALAEKHTFSKRVIEVAQWLEIFVEKNKQKKSTTLTILVAGHDLKFFSLLQKELESTGKYKFLIDQWQGHNKHDAQNSLKLLQQADIVFCEWCLGNVEWYSKNKLKYQRLIARFHAQESKLPYLANAKFDAIDHISFVSEHTRKEALENIPGLLIDKTSVIANYLDDKKFTPLKKVGDAKFVLGMIGVTPKGKRLDRAIDLLEMLLKEDNRYYLRIKGKNPLSYSWIHNRPEEIEYYKNIFNRINSNPLLRYRVIFDPPGDDVNQWLSLVGYILSPSDAESFHMAIGEGMLTGCIPIVWNWEGAKDIWGEKNIVYSLSEARDKVLSTQGELLIQDVGINLNKFIGTNIIIQWEEVLRNKSSL